MSNWKLIIDTYNALPAGDRTSVNVHSQLLKQGHSVSMVQVREVLSATVLSEMLTDEDVRVLVRTLNTVRDICSDDIVEIEPDSIDTDFAEGYTRRLTSIAGFNRSDLVKAMLRLVTDYRGFREFALEYDHIQRMSELRGRPDEDIPF